MFIVLSRFIGLSTESTELYKIILCRCIKRSINAGVRVNAVSVLVWNKFLAIEWINIV